MRAALVVLAALVAAWLPTGVDQWRRARFGVAPGVTLAGLPVGGWWESEVRELAITLAEHLRIEPADAVLTQTGTISPSQMGREMDVDATVRAVLAAAPGQRIEPVLLTVPPLLTERRFTPIRQGNPARPWVSLTINIDWGEEVLPALLSTLERLGVRATFFPTGTWAKKHPNLVRALSRAGHEIGTHGARHDHLMGLSDSQLDSLIQEGARTITEITGLPVHLFAPPYGEVDARIARRAGQLGFYTIMWSADSLDWMGKSAEQIVSRVLGKIDRGGIVLLHPKPETVKALPTLVAELRRRGYELVTVGTQLGLPEEPQDGLPAEILPGGEPGEPSRQLPASPRIPARSG